jgi:hypothetical protein
MDITLVEVLPIAQADPQLQKSMVRAIATIDAPDPNLKPYGEAYAKIEVAQPVPLYERCRRELMGLLKWRAL